MKVKEGQNTFKEQKKANHNHHQIFKTSQVQMNASYKVNSDSIQYYQIW